MLQTAWGVGQGKEGLVERLVLLERRQVERQSVHREPTSILFLT